MILAVLQTRCGLDLGAADVYLNVAGGIRISEPAADLAVAAALISAHLGQLLPARTVVFGEIGLGGEVRAVGHPEARLKEAEKLGFTSAIVPHAAPRHRGEGASQTAIATHNMNTLQDLFAIFDGALTAGKSAAL
jgi:DNA repair protein RadA/Sms